MVIIRDTREQRSLDFSFWKDIKTRDDEGIWPGDYTLLGGYEYLAVERKSVSDLIGTMKTGYSKLGAKPKRFNRELMGLAAIKSRGGNAFVLVEPDGKLGTVQSAYEQIRLGCYRGAAHPTNPLRPDMVFKFVKGIKLRYGVQTYFAESRTDSAEIIVRAARLALAIKKAKSAQDKEIEALESIALDGIESKEFEFDGNSCNSVEF